MSTYISKVCLYGGLLLLAVLGSGFSLHAQELGSGGIGGRPAYPREDNPRSESIFIHEIDPGDTVSDGIKVINNTDQARTIQVYSADSIVSSGGAFGCAQLVDEKVDVGNWIILDRAEVTLEGSSSEVIDFDINVPEGTDVGEHGGCVVVQEKKPIAENEQGIGLSFRTAIRVAVLVPGDVVKNLEIVGFDSALKHSEIVLTPQIENTGNVSVDAEISSTIDYFFGKQYSQVGGQYPVLRGQTGEWNFQHNRPFWGGIFKASVTATYDRNVENFIGSDNPDKTELKYDSIWLFVVPHPVAFAVELAVLLGVIYLMIRLRRSLSVKRAVKNDWRSYTVRSGDDVKLLAKKHGISWKALASANKLKAPYTLKAGDKIKLPASKAAAKGRDQPRKIDVIK